MYLIGLELSLDRAMQLSDERNVRASVVGRQLFLEHPAFLRNVLDQLADGVVVADRLGNFLVWNTAADALVGLSAEDMTNGQWPAHYGLFKPDNSGPFPVEQLPMVLALKGQTSRDVEMFVRNPAVPRGRYLSVSGSPLRDADGQMWGAAVVFHDVTARKQMVEEFARANLTLRRNMEALGRLALLDDLTSMPNRRHLNLAGKREIQRARSRHTVVSVGMIDADYFKPFNDAYGHPAGDRVLRQIGQQISKNVTTPNAFCGRYGGEEFTFVMPGVNLQQAELCGRLILRSVQALNIPHRYGSSGIVTVSLGIAECQPDLGVTWDAALQAADRALYLAKKAGRNCIRRTFIPASGQKLSSPKKAPVTLSKNFPPRTDISESTMGQNTMPS